MEREPCSPILRHEVGRFDPRLGDEGVKIADVVLEAIGDVRLARLAEADQVRREAMREVGDERNDVAPDVGRGRIAMQEDGDGGFAAAGFPIRHVRIEDRKL